ncbi:MAG: zinc ribbon domain-containing protein [bacterium]
MAEPTPAPPEAAAAGAEKYPCPLCGGLLNFDPKSGKLKCPYCGGETAIPEGEAGAVEEHSFEGFLGRVKTQVWGLQLTTIQCEACGAVTQTSDKVSSMNCPFCDHPMVLGNSGLAEDSIRPESVLPFAVDLERLMEGLRQWIRGHWFAPSDLAKYWQKEMIRPVYLPYWTFDANTHTSWTAEAGYYYYVRENNQDVRKVRWESASGARDDFFDDELLCASKGLPTMRLQQIEPFRTQELKPYRPEYLAGYLCERYAIGPREAWQGAQARMMAKLRALCSRDVPGDTQRNLQVYPQFSDIKIKHTLLPIYLGRYNYKGKTYPFYANGQTGKVSGERPISWVKVLLTVMGIILLIVLYASLKN